MASGIGSTVSGAAAANSGGTSRSTLASNFDAFLLLLTTQLRNQSPLEPLDTNQFTQQLVQFASVEQQLKSNETLQALLTSSRSATASSAADFVGMTVTADGSTAQLTNGQARWTVTAPRAVAQAVVTIRDATGNIVANRTQSLPAGASTVAWDGIASDGSRAPAGEYTISVTGRDVAGQTVSIKTEVSGVVDRVDLADGTPVLVIGSNRVPLAKVRSVARAAS